MYKRFIRWASDRLADDGIIGFITNRRFLDARQDDGFRQIAGQEFTDIYILDLGSDVRRNPKISGTTHNVFGIQTGVAITFFVREKAKLGKCSIHYARRDDDELATDKLAYLGNTELACVALHSIEPDEDGNWLNQSVTNFPTLIPIANKPTMQATIAAEEQAAFKLHAPGVMTGRDEWVYDFEVSNLRNKALFFADAYNGLMDENSQTHDTTIKWSRDLRNEFRRGRRIIYSEAERIQSLYRPFTVKWHCANFVMNDVMTRNHYAMFGPDMNQVNTIISIKGPAAEGFSVLATDKIIDYKCGFTGNGGTFCLPLYRYTADGERVSNITEWGLRQFREHYGDDGISAEDVFAYTYAMLHDPAYRQRYEVDLRREFPRVYFQEDFAWWAEQGRELLDLHLGFETAEPWPLERVDSPTAHPELVEGRTAGPSTGSGRAARVILRADREKGIIQLDDRTALAGVPPDAWEYRLGSRSALEWVLDQYKERKPRDPTIAERFNTYRFADHKERVIDLLGRVCAVSAFTSAIVDELGAQSSIG